jgi:hypothetical protein
MGDGKKKLTALEISELAEMVTKMGTPGGVLRRILNEPRTKQVLMGIVNGRLQLNGVETEMTKFQRLQAESRGRSATVVKAQRAEALQRKHALAAAAAAMTAAEKARKAEVAAKCAGWTLSTFASLPREELKKLAHDELVYVFTNSGVTMRHVIDTFNAACVDELAFVCVTDATLEKVAVFHTAFDFRQLYFYVPLSYLSRQTLLQFIFYRSGGRHGLWPYLDDGNIVMIRKPTGVRMRDPKDVELEEEPNEPLIPGPPMMEIMHPVHPVHLKGYEPQDDIISEHDSDPSDPSDDDSDDPPPHHQHQCSSNQHQ